MNQKNLQFCEAFLARANDLNEIIAREKLIGSESTIQFELNRLTDQFNLKEIVFTNGSPEKISKCSTTPFGFKARHTVFFGSQNMGEIQAGKSASFNDIFFTLGFFLPLFVSASGALILFSYLNRRLSQYILNPITKISTDAAKITNFQMLKDDGLSFSEFTDLVQAINRMSMQINISTEKIHQLEASAKISEIAKQVAHDIRSPLSALTMILNSLDQVSEDKRILIRTAVQRINDIANDLLNRGRSASENQPLKNPNALSIEFLAPIIDTIVSEKRIHFREKKHLEIEVDLDSSYGVFANINPIELKRTISNLVNNAVEALPEDSGKIVVAVRKNGNNPSIIIQDNGKGIPEHILKKLGEHGITHGKDGITSGNGLGIYHAKKTIQDVGGKFQIQSQEGIGTLVTLIFPTNKTPNWFVEKLIISAGTEVCSLDDDISIHQIWQGRFESLNATNYRVKLMAYTSAEDFKNWIISSQNQNDISNNKRLYLIDFELLNQSINGLDIIESTGIAPNTILVTSRYEEQTIRERCKNLGVKIIPKAMAGFVPIEIIE
ncbi:MAG: sensor histidine kinase [Neobacillus sp.]